MAQLDFFALDEDFYSLVQFLLSETDLIVYEAYSPIDEDIRRVTTTDALKAMAGERQGGGFLLRAWSPEVTRRPLFRTIILRPEIGGQRTTLEGAGIMQLQQGLVEHGHLHRSSLGHWNEAGARQALGDIADEVDWMAMRRLSGRINRHVRNQLAVAKLYSAPVLPQAYACLGADLSLWYAAREHRQNSENMMKRPGKS